MRIWSTVSTTPHLAIQTPAAYLELLDRALEDRRLTDTEAEVLAATAAEWGLAADSVQLAHGRYFDSVLLAAKADGVITELEHADLQLVASVLRLDPDIVQRRIDDAAPIEPPAGIAHPPTSLAGLSVCFTGALVGRIDDQLITRDQAQALAQQAGLIVKKNVSKGLDLLVVADPDSQSGKAKKAREFGTRVMAEAVFWSIIGVPVE